MTILSSWVIALLSLNINTTNMMDPTQTVTGLFIATDQRNWQQVAQLFDDQVILDYSSMNGNPASTMTPDQIISAWKSILPGFEHTHHQLGNLVASGDKTTAEVFCYGTANHFLPDNGGSVWTVVGTYNFQLAKKATGQWKISSMTFNFKYQDGNTALPEKAINNLK